MTVNSGTLTVGNSATGVGNISGTGALTVNSGGILKVDDSFAVVNNRLNTTASAARNIAINGGTFSYVSNNTGNSSETLGTLTIANGLATISDTNAGVGGGNSTLAFGAMTINAGGAVNFTSPQTFVSAVAANAPLINIAGAANTNGLLSLNGGRTYVTNSTSGSVDFATFSGVGTSIVAYSAYNNSAAYTNINDASAVLAARTVDNLRIGPAAAGNITSGTASTITANPFIATNQAPNAYSRTVNSLNLAGSGATANTLDATTSGFYLNLNSGASTGAGILASSGTNNVIGSNLIVFTGAVETAFGVASGATLDFQAALQTTAAGVQKNLPGTLILSTHEYDLTAGTFYLNGGTLKLNAGLNTLYNPASYTINTQLQVNAGGTLELNGNAQVIGTLSTSGSTTTIIPTPTAIITSTNGTGTLVVGGAATSANWGGSITDDNGVTGRVNFVHSVATLALLGTNTYTGFTLLNGGTLTLESSGTFSTATGSVATAASGTGTGIDLNGATLTLDNNTGLSNINNRLGGSAVLNLRSGTFTMTGRQGMFSSETLAGTNFVQGGNTVTATTAKATSQLSSTTINLGAVTRSNNATVNFTSSAGTLGQLTSGTNVDNPYIFASSGLGLTNGLVPWATVGGADFATYNSTVGVLGLGAAGGPGYTTATLLTTTNPADNITVATAAVSGINSVTINALRTQTTAPTFTFNAGQTLTLGSGGLLINIAATTIGNVANNGNLTSGTSELDVLANTTGTINSVITGGITLVKGLGGVLTLGSANTPANSGYTGGTVINAGGITLATTGSLGSGGVTVNSGGAFIQTGLGLNAGIGNQAWTINGGGSVTLAVPATASTVQTMTGLTFNDYGGGNSNPALTLAAGVNLAIGAGGITSSSSNTSNAATVTLGLIDISANPTITVNPIQAGGVTLNTFQPSLVISSTVIGSTTNAALLFPTYTVTKAGAGSLRLSAQNTFTGGFNLNAGNIDIGGSSSGTAAAFAGAGQTTPLFTTGPLGTGTVAVASGASFSSIGGASTLLNAMSFAGNVNFLGGVGFTLNGNIALGATSPTTHTLNVDAPQLIVTLGGNITGTTTGGITKTGYGTLILNNAGSSFDGGVTVNNGTLQIGAASRTALGVGGTPFGTGGLTYNGGLVSFVIGNSGSATATQGIYGTAGVISFPTSNVTINATQTAANFNVQSGGGSGSINETVALGTLNNLNGTAPAAQINVTGGNGYKLLFNDTNLTSATTGGSNALGAATFNIATGVTVILGSPATGAITTGGFTNNTKPTNIGAGTLLFTGNQSFNAPASISTATIALPTVNASTTPLGLTASSNTTALTLNTGATLTFNPVVSSNTAITGTGANYTTGGLSTRYYAQSNGTTGSASVAIFGGAPAAVINGTQLGDIAIRNTPNTVLTSATIAAGPSPYSAISTGIIRITNAGAYNFAVGVDDQAVVFVDGMAVSAMGSTGVGVFAGTPISTYLSAGAHTFSVQYANGSGGGGLQLFYGGPDTASAGLTGTINNFVAIPGSVLSYANNAQTAAWGNAAVLNNPYTVTAANTVTFDGQGTNFNTGVATLTLNAGSQVNAVNIQSRTAAGASWVGVGNLGVNGVTTVAGAGAIINNTSAGFVLNGGVTDSGNGLSKIGSGRLILNSGGTFTGPMNIVQGALQPLAAGALPTTVTGITTIGSAVTQAGVVPSSTTTFTPVSTTVLCRPGGHVHRWHHGFCGQHGHYRHLRRRGYD